MKGVAERFWIRVERAAPDACWIWRGKFYPDGYGFLTFRKQPRRAHRISYVLARGLDLAAIDAKCVCHSCDNPKCVNPAHLFLGTHADNVRDKVTKGRQAKGLSLSSILKRVAARGDASGARKHPERLRRGAKCPWSKLSEADVLAIRTNPDALTQRELAKRFGISQGHVSGIVTARKWAAISQAEV